MLVYASRTSGGIGIGEMHREFMGNRKFGLASIEYIYSSMITTIVGGILIRN